MKLGIPKKLCQGKGLKIPGRHVGPGYLIMDRDNNICVATLLVKMGEKIQTSLGMGKRYDTCGAADVVDIYTNW